MEDLHTDVDVPENKGDESLLPKAEPEKASYRTDHHGPVWEMVVMFGKRTTINFSPWADR